MNKTDLSRNHVTALLSILWYVDNLLIDVEKILAPSYSRVLFPQYIVDCLTEKRSYIEEEIRCFRDAMASVMADVGVSPEPPSVSARRFFSTSLSFAEMSLEKIKPEHMVAYGKMTPSAEKKLAEIFQFLQISIRKMKKNVL